MNRITDDLFSDLYHWISQLGNDGGLISPSIYDTAQVLRMAPPKEGVEQGLEWLLCQQQADGGWGNLTVPRTRDTATLAAILALHTHNDQRHFDQAIQNGLTFLQEQSEIWEGGLPEDLPVGVELILPHLLAEAAQAGLYVDTAPYALLITLGQRRRKLIAQHAARAGMTAAHSWEAWGHTPDPALLDASGSVGHSPSATAAWLRAAADRPELADHCARARDYLSRAAITTRVGIPGVVPGVWPIKRFEQAFALYMLLIAGVLQHPRLAPAVDMQLRDLYAAFKPTGIGFSDYFIPDGDDTAAALAVLKVAGYSVDASTMDHFNCADHFCAFPGELQPSLSVTAHAVHALACCGMSTSNTTAFLLDRQLCEGFWPGDKWNSSWVYTTSQVMIALNPYSQSHAIDKAIGALMRYQHADGGWGMYTSTLEETGYGILALRALARNGLLHEHAEVALHRAEQYMQRKYHPSQLSRATCWLDKDVYRPERLSRIIELAATLPRSEVLSDNASAFVELPAFAKTAAYQIPRSSLRFAEQREKVLG